MRAFLRIIGAIASLVVSRAALEVCHRLGFYPETWLAELTMGLLSSDTAFWVILGVVALAVWAGLQLVANRWFRSPTVDSRDALIAVNNEGVALLNEGNITTQVGAWTFKFSDWHRRTLEAAEAYSPALRNRLEPIKRFTVPDEPVAVDDQSHKVNVKIVAEVMRRVDAWLANKADR